MKNADMVPGRVRLAQAARHLLSHRVCCIEEYEAPPHEHGITGCIQPFVLGGRTDVSWDSLEGATFYFDLEVHTKRIARVWAMPILGPSIDLTRYCVA